MKYVILILLAMGGNAFAGEQCSHQVVGGRAELNAQVCGYTNPWACYEKLLTTCTQENGVINQFEQVIFAGCVQSFDQCRK